MELPDFKCDVCNDEPAVGVASVPGIPASCAYGRRCLDANAHPYGLVVVNTAMVGGYENAAPWWKEMVDATLTHLGKTREQFEADVLEEIREQEEHEKSLPERSL